MQGQLVHRHQERCTVAFSNARPKLKIGVMSGSATIQPELMDACLDWMACISIDASWLLS